MNMATVIDASRKRNLQNIMCVVQDEGRRADEIHPRASDDFREHFVE